MSDAVMFASSVLAAAGFFRAARAPELRRSLMLLGWSGTAWMAGVATWLAVESRSAAGSGLSPVSGGAMVLGSALILAAMLTLPVAPASKGAKLRLLVDGLLVATSFLFVVWEPAIDPALRSTHHGAASLLATLALPVADVVVLLSIAVITWRSTGGRLMLGLLLASAAVRTLTDVRFVSYALDRLSGRNDTLIDVGWALSYALLALAALAAGSYAGRVRERHAAGRRLQLVMYLPVGAALGTAVGLVVAQERMRGPELTVLLVIAGLLVVRQWITLGENGQLLSRVAFDAEHDDLTGLLNRVGLLRRLAASVASDAAVRVHLIDIDRFKDVNDTLGHPEGDALLIAIAMRLQGTARGLHIARLSGDEFAVIDGRHDASGLAERLLAAIGQPYTVAGRPIHLDASLGIAAWEGSDDDQATDPDRIAVDLLRDADSAMYAAKASGGGVRLFENELRTAMLDRVALGRELRDALARGGELALAYQPIVDLAHDGVPYVEALARWSHPTRGNVPPGVFIPIAETSGLMPMLGRWVLRTACAQAAAWNRDGLDVGVCVNVSVEQLDNATIVTDVNDTLRRTGLPPERLMLELTESLFVDDSDACLRPLETLHAAGIRIAIDDFGTGYSALGYLRRLPVDTLKLDRRFVSELDAADIAVVTAIVTMSRALGLDTIAEGIETQEQLEILRRLGCDYGQGYHLARPMDAAAVPAHLGVALPKAA
ncbi:MAG TPA: bifunctional diguanylate cyclase/phosphodiesterase [Gaiellales bacterium]